MAKKICDTISIDGVLYKTESVPTETIKSLDDLIGRSLLIRTVTYFMLGRVDAIVDGFMVLSTASWVADTGRFMQAIQNGTLNEVEPVGIAYVQIASIVDMFPWVHSLHTAQK